MLHPCRCLACPGAFSSINVFYSPGNLGGARNPPPRSPRNSSSRAGGRRALCLPQAPLGESGPGGSRRAGAAGEDEARDQGRGGAGFQKLELWPAQLLPGSLGCKAVAPGVWDPGVWDPVAAGLLVPGDSTCVGNSSPKETTAPNQPAAAPGEGTDMEVEGVCDVAFLSYQKQDPGVQRPRAGLGPSQRRHHLTWAPIA